MTKPNFRSPRFRRLFFPLAALAALATLIASPQQLRAADPAKLELHQGDHISIIGNTLADRMQHDGWLETILQARFPKSDLVIRNLGFSGDELNHRERSDGFGSPDEHMTKEKADVVLAFFGYNESFAGEAGLPDFKKQLDAFIKHTLTQKYNGKAAPRLVLFSPIAHENLHDRNLPDGSENNARLKLYTAAMEEVAKANDVPFVDLFNPTQELYARTASAQSLTINGVHLNERGNRLLAELIDKSLFPGQPAAVTDAKVIDKIRQAVVDKNFYWFNRYRTVDGYSIYGGRADLKFVDGQTNRVVMDREMEVLDDMTANRDKTIWAAAQGQDVKADDSNLPPFLVVKTNKPGPGPNLEHIFLDGGDESIAKMTIAKNMKINLFASEKQFPELVNPVQMAWDTKGRLWVAAWQSYPHWKPTEDMNDKLLIFEDTKGTGKADKMTVFADHLHCPTGFEFWNGGVLIAQAPDIMFLKDSTGGDHCDTRTRVVSGMDSADTHHTSNSFVLDPGGAMYWQEGTFHHTQVETAWGPEVRNSNAGVYRYEPRTQKFDAYVTYGFANPHGHVFDRWGQDFVIDGTGSNPYHAALFSGHMDFPQKHNHPPEVYKQRTRPCPGAEVLSSRQFPDENQGNLLVSNVITFQGILQYKFEDQGASFTAHEVEPIVSSTDPNFRPADVKIGPDGAIYFSDWHNPIIGHMQHNLRDPSRDRTHGRIYRVVYDGRPLLKSPAIAGQPIEQLLDVLKEPEARVRSRARIELSARDTDQVMAACTKWIAGLDTKDPNYEHNMLEALWLHQQHNVVDVDLLKRVLASPDFQARAAATHVLCYWRDRVPGSLDLLKKLAADEHPRVRLEAVRAASFFTEPEAVEVALISTDHPTDQYLDFVRTETMKTLEPYWKKAVSEGKTINITSDAGARFFLKNISTDQLLKMKPTRAIYIEMLSRKGLEDKQRQSAITGLAKLDNKPELPVLIDAIRDLDSHASAQDETVVFDLLRMLTSHTPAEMAEVRASLVDMATKAKLAVIRQLGFVALIAADGNVDKAWELGLTAPGRLMDLVSAMPLIHDPNVRASLYPKVEPLLKGLPEPLSKSSGAKGTTGRYVRVELPGNGRTLTLAEVEVFSDGRNVARQGKAAQISTGYGGSPERAIDGKTDGSYSAGTASHTAENEKNPWWEVDLGQSYPIDSVVIFNRTDGDFGERLKGFTVSVLESDRSPVYEQKNQPAPAVKATFDLGGGGGSEGQIRRAAMEALTSVRGQEARTFKALAGFVREGVDRNAAVRALQRIPTTYWAPEEIKPLEESLMGYIRKLPVQDRTSPAALDAMQLADSLAGLLPLDEAKQLRKELSDLGVRVIRLSTVPERMAYDKERVAVQAGKPVEFVIENNDLMPHNFVIVQPGTMEEIGLKSEAEAQQPGAAERGFVPQSNKILAASHLVQPRSFEKVPFATPQKAGVYPYVCTYPGHWRRMYGALYVVDDLEQYQADPEGYLASHPLPISDELLKNNRPRKEWKFEDLSPLAEHLEHTRGRNYANGRQMFTVGNCIACHKLDNVGNQIGPDLSKLDAKLTPVDIIHDIVEPSFRINEKFQTFIFQMESGKVVTGMILEETADTVKVIENPLLKAEAVVLKKSEISQRAKSAVSIMPKGLLDKMTSEEIMDLVAYIASRGDQHSPLFEGGEHVHNH